MLPGPQAGTDQDAAKTASTHGILHTLIWVGSAPATQKGILQVVARAPLSPQGLSSSSNSWAWRSYVCDTQAPLRMCHTVLVPGFEGVADIPCPVLQIGKLRLSFHRQQRGT
jgi:hypothetical protein